MVKLAELCEAGDELIVFASAVEVSALLRVGELWEAASTDDELVAFAISVLVTIGELWEATSTDDELVVAASAFRVSAVVPPNSPSEFVADALDCPHFDRTVRCSQKSASARQKI